MPTLPRIRAAWLPTVAALLLSTLSLGPARAASYEYRYVGNPFTMTTTSATPEPGDPTGGRMFELVRIEATVIANDWLTGDVTMNDIRSFSLTLFYTRWGAPDTLDFPPIPSTCWGCPSGPEPTATFSMGDFNALHQPTRWDLSIHRSIFYPPGLENWLTISTSTQRDLMDGGYETLGTQTGGLINSAGIWSVTAVVPEPSSGWLSLAGVAGLAVWGAQRRRAGGPRHGALRASRAARESP